MKKYLPTFFITALFTITASIAGCTAMTGNDSGASFSSSAALSSANSSAHDANVVVSIDDVGFQATSVTVTKGSMVTWINDGTLQHSIEGDDGGPDSEVLAHGETYSYTFNTAGTYTYHCSFHPTMVGVIVVTE